MTRAGQDHPAAKLTDHDVALLLELWGEGWSYARLAECFGLSKGGVAKIVTGQRRGLVGRFHGEG